MKALIGVLLLSAIGSAAKWHLLSWAGSDTLREVQFADSMQGWAMATKDLFHTTDRGRTWTVEQTLPPDSGNFHSGFAGLEVVDSCHVYLSGGLWSWSQPRYMNWTVFVKERLRGSWTTPFHLERYGDYHWVYARRLRFLDTLTGWHLGQDYEVDVRTNDGGASWRSFVSFEDSSEAGYDAWFIDTLTGWAVWDSVGMTTNGGDSWSPKTANIGARRIQMFDTLNGWVLSTYGLMQTTNGGDSWTTVVAETGLKAMRFCNPRHGVAVGLNGRILRTTDAGASWMPDTASAAMDLCSVFMVDSAHAWAVGAEGLVLGFGDWAKPGIDGETQLPLPVLLARAWPNPCRGTLWITVRDGAGSVVVYDDCGRPVAKVQSSTRRTEKLDLRSLPTGVYFARAASSPRAGVRFVLLR
ncbi:hypothetical protein FJY68_02780 [candidate division WOR-3 bacterium]|uniref:Secretion system C-terminal sorting domain-containing protein n=1 Tax=candidate division WOR-3 bacterium TaxID=2052148 RepID=A0A938BP31_UNCW3|nr:hypothetical protein [candidate division WOR-3 bacterium]